MMKVGSFSIWIFLPFDKFSTVPTAKSTANSSPVSTALDMPFHSIAGKSMLMALQKKIPAKDSAITHFTPEYFNPVVPVLCLNHS